MPRKLTKEEIRIREEAWRRGILRWKLDSNQQSIYDAIRKMGTGSFYFNKPRRIGGSYLECLMAIEECLRKPRAQVKYAAPTAKAVRKIITPNIRKIIEDCPDDLKPKWNTMEQDWIFPNGSVLSVAGCDNGQFENLRGTEADAVFLDEVGFIDELKYVLSDVLMPQIQDTDGYIVLCSTPPRSPSHESFQIAMAHKQEGNYYHCTVWDNPRRTKDQHKRFFERMAAAAGQGLEEFYASTTFRREYLGEFVTDEERSVIPEWSKTLEDYITKVPHIPKFRDRYVSLDPGFKDGMAAVFGYWDYHAARLVIEDEYLSFRKTAKEVAESIKAKEIELWGAEKPFLRISDDDIQFIADLNNNGITFVPTRKQDKELWINQAREWFRARKIFINPRCKRLLTQLASTVWNKQRTSYERNSDGHGDLLDALIYLIRNVRRDRNPYPRGHGRPEGFDVIEVMEPDDQVSKVGQVLTLHFSEAQSDESNSSIIVGDNEWIH
jgi:hypothetical protein